MNTKQVEELTGLSRQNIRYYERQGLLTPARDTGNAYRDYSDEDVLRLKLIKMMRMLDMSLKDIEQVLREDISLKEAAARQQENLQKQQKLLQAAIDVCTSIHKDKSESVDVDGYLAKMETMSRNGGMFAKIVDDYKQVALEEQQRRVSFYSPKTVNTAGEFEETLRKYATERQMTFRLIEGGMYPKFALDDATYTAARVLEEDDGTKEAVTRIVCIREPEEDGQAAIPESRRKAFQGVHSIAMNIRRHRFKSILNVVISLLTVVVMAFYLGNLTSTARQLQDLPDAIPVSAQIWNVCGEQSFGLFIPERVVDTVYGSSHTRRIRESAELLGQVPDADIDSDYRIQGISEPQCVSGLEEGDITWAKGWDMDRFRDSEKVCVVEEAFLKNHKVTPGDELPLSLDHYIMDVSGMSLERKDLADVRVEIAGTVDVGGLDTEEAPAPDILLPLSYVRQIYEECDVTYFASSLSFLVKDPMKLNALKQELKDAKLQTVIQEAPFSYAGAGVRVDDAVFIEAATSLQKSLSLFKGFLPFVLLVVVMVGYIVPHLLLQGRREEYAIMRALGTSRRRCTMLFFIEHLLLAVVGGGAGAVTATLLGAVGAATALLVWTLFLVCYGLGTAAAMWMFGRFSVAAVLSHRD